ncbi:MAG: sodium/proton-translocating pyrophosphatase, partial [Polyangiaceae bacterium]
MKSIKARLVTVALLLVTLTGFSAFAQVVHPGLAPAHAGGEDSLRVPDLLDTQQFFGMPASHLLLMGLAVSAAGIVFGLAIFFQLKNAPVHKSMLEVSELIYETCKTYLFTQAKFLGLLWVFIGAVIVVYYGVLKGEPMGTVVIILLFSILGIAGSALVALFGIRVNTFANSRTAFAALRGKPFPVYAIPLKAGMS